MIHLDTSFLIRALESGSPEDDRLTAWLRARRPVHIAAPAWAEFLCGPPAGSPASGLASLLLGVPLPFGDREATLTARLFNAAGRRRGSFTDCMIAATAIVAGASLATGNTDDFVRLVPHGLLLAR